MMDEHTVDEALSDVKLTDKMHLYGFYKDLIEYLEDKSEKRISTEEVSDHLEMDENKTSYYLNLLSSIGFLEKWNDDNGSK